MVIVASLRFIEEVDPEHALTVIFESELNQRVFNSLAKWYQDL